MSISLESTYAVDYMRTDCIEYYNAPEALSTIPSHMLGNYDGILNERGIELFNKAEAGINDSCKTIVKYNFGTENSGPWFPDTESIYYLKTDFSMLNSHSNFRVIGITSELKPINTSPAIFITKTWCLTKSGTIYKLGELVGYESILKMFEPTK